MIPTTPATADRPETVRYRFIIMLAAALAIRTCNCKAPLGAREMSGCEMAPVPFWMPASGSGTNESERQMRTDDGREAGAAAPVAPGSAPAAAAPPRCRVRCRPIEPADIDALADLLARGFPVRDRARWAQALARIHDWHAASGLPGSGFLLEDDGARVGALLTVYGPEGRRCNLSSWYVEDGYRRYGQMLVSAALRDRSVTYVNITPERHTWPIIEAQGFRRYAPGIVAALPLLALARPARRARVEAAPPGDLPVDASERLLVEQHRAMGCIAFWCVAEGRAHPFVFARRTVRGMPVAQLVYCAEGTDWRRFAAAVGLQLARRGLFVLLADAPGPLPGLPGRYLPGRMPKYARGPSVPRCGDLAYTETALFGT